MRTSTFFFASSILLAGCPTRNQVQGNNDGNMSNADAGHGDGSNSDGGDGSAAPLPKTVSITAPAAATTYTNGSVSIVVSTDVPTTIPISIVAVGTTTTTVGTVTESQASFNWDTTSVAEGTYSVTAQLTVNGKTLQSNAVTIVVDRTPPKVVVTSLVPAPGATNVALAAPLVVGFSEPILPSSVTSTTVTVQAGPTTLPTTVVLSADGMTATINITSSAGITLPLTFSGTLAVTDLAGNQLAALSPSWTWNVPDWIKFAPIGSNAAPLLAVGTDFHPVIAYALCGQGNAGNSCPLVLHVAVNTGQAWTDLGVPDATDGSGLASLAVDPQNHPFLAWGVATTAAVGEVRFAKWNGATWDTTFLPPITVPTANGYNVDAVVARLDSSGNPTVAYRVDATSGTSIYVARWTGSAWDTSYGQVGATATTSFDLLVDDQGNPVVGAVNQFTSGAYVWNGLSWIFGSGAGASNAFLGLDASGDPVMLDTASGWIPERLSGSAWLPDGVNAPVPASITARDPHLTNTLDRYPAVAWYDPSTSPSKLGVTRWTGSAWDSRAGLISAGGSPSDMPPSIVVDGRNSIWLGWLEGLQANAWMSNY